MDADRLLDPTYDFFRDEPESDWTLTGLPAIRTRIEATFPTPEHSRCEQHWSGNASGDAKVRLCVYRPEANEAATTPAILYVHGGGFVLGRPEMLDDYLAQLARQLNATIIAVDYRLAPEHPFPLPLEDCYSALAWIWANAGRFNLDTRRVVVMGHSAGGGLAAALTILARDRGRYGVRGLVLIYPMLDHRTGSAEEVQPNPSTGTFSWSREANQFCWACMQGEYRIDDERAGYFSPSRAANLAAMPPTFLSTGALDLFLEEDVAFALRLSRAGVAVELHVYPGVPHMFDQHPGALTDQANLDTVRALEKMLAPSADPS
ncbi:alpha/beta hydrolase [Pseudomonas sp. v388]|uniref:alpha/beta hydrolase n=1 Tax=Pseudomonas sp. v388 TaxID=2479849 RepID=UPI000F793D23|nr:alpha/beta hydrolase [Pseudomonas sp. v388]RRV10172.1 alpha/beta hydrolase [Pseudomonas sp. v388]